MDISRERKKRLMSQYCLAKKINISQSQLSLIEKKYIKLTPEILNKILQIFREFDLLEKSQ